MFRTIIIIIIVSSVSVVGVYAFDSYRDGRFGSEACPKDMAFVPSSNGGFCIDKYESSAGERCPFAAPVNPEESLLNLEDGRCQAMSVAGEKPWTYITQMQAARACARAGKRLPTPVEWQQAALAQAGEAGCQLDREWPEQPGPAGYSQDCRSAGSVYDLAGNVWEWVDGQSQDGMYAGRSLPDSGYIAEMGTDGLALATAAVPSREYGQDYWWIKKSGSRSIAKGGYFLSGERGGIFAANLEMGLQESSPGIGFRCVR